MLTLVGRHHAPSIMHDNYDDDMRDDTASTELETCTYVHTTTCARATKDNHMIYDDCNWKLSLFAALWLIYYGVSYPWDKVLIPPIPA